ncbi:MAG: NUDIX domain-containing protein [Chromatiales bacterium]|jgi:8-oxo-dGTP pyrophosphatase MutT (NUDIX family)|nr:NUDIX domain-containing protein [Chromatiales bacterium]
MSMPPTRNDAGKSRRAGPVSCGAIVLRETPDGLRVLMLRVFRHWDFPKGLMEAGEVHLQTARREVCEESSISQLDFPWGEVYVDTGPYNRGKIARYYLALTRQSTVELLPSPDTGRPEHSEYRWVSLGEAHRLGSPRVRLALSWAESVLSRAGVIAPPP